MPKTKNKKQKNEPKINIIERLEISPRYQIALAIILFSASAVFVHGRDMTNLEIAILQGVYNLPSIVAAVFSIVTHFGNIYILLGIALLALIRHYYHMAVRLLFTGSFAYLLSGVMKDLVGRDRPQEFITDLIYRDIAVRGSSFPSGHMALATALLLTLSLYMPVRYKWIAPVSILLVGLSRLNLGVHGPMDIVGGFAIGWASVALFKFVNIRLTSGRD